MVGKPRPKYYYSLHIPGEHPGVGLAGKPLATIVRHTVEMPVLEGPIKPKGLVVGGYRAHYGDGALAISIGDLKPGAKGVSALAALTISPHDIFEGPAYPKELTGLPIFERSNSIRSMDDMDRILDHTIAHIGRTKNLSEADMGKLRRTLRREARGFWGK